MLVPYTPGLFSRGYVPVSKALAVINIVAFIVVETLPAKFSEALALSPQEGLSWQLLSYQFMHAGIWHLVGNMAFLLAFGPVVEEKLGGAKTVLIYLIGGVLAGAAWMSLEEPMILLGEAAIYAPLIGASGSISALTGASMVLRPHVPMAGIIWIFIIIFQVSFPVWVWALYFFIMDYLNFFGGFFSSQQTSSVAYSAHLGGFVAGFLMIVVMRNMGWVKPASSDLISHFSKAGLSKPKKAFQPKEEPSNKDPLINWHLPSTLPIVLRKLESGEDLPVDKLIALSHVSREQGQGVGAYQMLQAWLERHDRHQLAPKVAYELGILCLRHLGRADLAKAWFDDVLRRSPNDDLRRRTETALSVL